MESSLPYHEPSILTIIILSGFLLLLNAVNWGLDKLIYCGLIGQVMLGIAWGTPGARWLSEEIEVAVVQLGFLGLLLIVYEGGLETSFKALKANLVLSVGVAATGIVIPMGLSFVLAPLVDATPLQCFAAGAALCSTSLGTTFTILGTSGLSGSRLGVVLVSAAMMDDVVGLIMVKIISGLGTSGNDSFNIVTVIRPIAVSVGFALIVPVVSWLVVLPLTRSLNAARERKPGYWLDQWLSKQQTALVIHTVILLGLVFGGTYAGTSGLFAAYIAGASVSWWDSDVPHVNMAPQVEPSATNSENIATRVDNITPIFTTATTVASSGHEVWHLYYEKAVQRVLRPFFFASIGFSVPITRMFQGGIVWRGIIYSTLMILGKLACGIWLTPFASPMPVVRRGLARLSRSSYLEKASPSKRFSGAATPRKEETSRSEQPTDGIGQTAPEADPAMLSSSEPTASNPSSKVPHNDTPDPKMSASLYPACIIGLALVARGEIGFLISALAEGNGIFGAVEGGEPSSIFLIVTWAISLCTMLGPICVGLLVGRVRKLEATRASEKRGDVLGAWGVS